MDTNVNPHEMPRVAGWVMVAPAGTTVPTAVPYGCTFNAPGWSDEWRMADDIPVLAVLRNGCPTCDDVAFSVMFYGQGPTILDDGHVAMVIDDSGSGIRLVMPDVGPCAHQRTSYHVSDGDPAWYVLVAGYYEVRPYRPAVRAVTSWTS